MVNAFIKAVCRKWYLWSIGSLGAAQTVGQSIGVETNMEWYVGAIVLLFFLLLASVLAYSDLYNESTKAESTSKGSTVTKTTNLKYPSWETVRNLRQQVMQNHGHDDMGIESDFNRGMTNSQIMKEHCSVCGKPRNTKLR